eukprot:scpid109517/ scgid21176/ 
MGSLIPPWAAQFRRKQSNQPQTTHCKDGVFDKHSIARKASGSTPTQRVSGVPGRVSACNAVSADTQTTSRMVHCVKVSFTRGGKGSSRPRETATVVQQQRRRKHCTRRASTPTGRPVNVQRRSKKERDRER